MNWKNCYKNEIRGFESSLVIVYGFEDFDYEVFTRAKHHLIIVTVQDSRLDGYLSCIANNGIDCRHSEHNQIKNEWCIFHENSGKDESLGI